MNVAMETGGDKLFHWAVNANLKLSMTSAQPFSNLSNLRIDGRCSTHVDKLKLIDYIAGGRWKPNVDNMPLKWPKQQEDERQAPSNATSNSYFQLVEEQVAGTKRVPCNYFKWRIIIYHYYRLTECACF
jgi:hypothetical protein